MLGGDKRCRNQRQPADAGERAIDHEIYTKQTRAQLEVVVAAAAAAPVELARAAKPANKSGAPQRQPSEIGSERKRARKRERARLFT